MRLRSIAFLVALLAPIPALAEVLVLKDGRRIEGEVLGFKDGQYHVLLADGAERLIDEGLVKDVIISAGGRLDRLLQEVRDVLLGDAAGPETRRKAVRDAAAIKKTFPYIDQATLGDLARVLRDGGDKAVARKDLAVAVEAYIEAMRLDKTLTADLRPLCVSTYDALARDALAAGTMEEGIGYLRKVMEWDPARRAEMADRVRDLYLAEGKRLLAKKDFDALRAFLGRAGDVLPNDPMIETLLDDGGFAEARDKTSLPAKDEAAITAQLAVWQAYLAAAPDGPNRREAERVAAELKRSLDILDLRSQDDLPGIYFPLVEGAWWHYEGQGFDERISISGVREEHGAVVADVVQESVERQPIPEAKGEMAASFAPPAFKYNYQYVRNGHAAVQVSGPIRDVRLAFPIRVGGGWTERSGGVTYEWSYASLSEEVVTRAGVFRNCLQVKLVSRYNLAEIRPQVIQFYYAPGVGLVKTDWADRDDYDWELTSYFAREAKKE